MILLNKFFPLFLGFCLLAGFSFHLSEPFLVFCFCHQFCSFTSLREGDRLVRPQQGKINVPGFIFRTLIVALPPMLKWATASYIPNWNALVPTNTVLGIHCQIMPLNDSFWFYIYRYSSAMSFGTYNMTYSCHSPLKLSCTWGSYTKSRKLYVIS